MTKYGKFVPKHISNELIRVSLMENAIWEEEQTENLTEVADDVEPFVYDDDNFSYNLWLTHHTAVPNVENKSVGWDDFLTSLFQIIIGVKENLINRK